MEMTFETLTTTEAAVSPGFLSTCESTIDQQITRKCVLDRNRPARLKQDACLPQLRFTVETSGIELTPVLQL